MIHPILTNENRDLNVNNALKSDLSMLMYQEHLQLFKKTSALPLVLQQLKDSTTKNDFEVNLVVLKITHLVVDQ